MSDICKTTYEEIKKDKKHRYVVFFIRDEKQIDVEFIGKQWQRFSHQLTGYQNMSAFHRMCSPVVVCADNLMLHALPARNTALLFWIKHVLHFAFDTGSVLFNRATITLKIKEFKIAQVCM